MTADPETRKAVLDGYETHATDLIDRFDTIPSEVLFAPVAAHLPGLPCDMLDLGAGTGRDASWFAGQGHRVWAVEPVVQFRNFGRARRDHVIWIDDTLPELSLVSGMNKTFDLVVLNGVLHHLSPLDQETALRSVGQLMSSRGRAVLSLRHGPAPASRPGFPISTETLLSVAATSGLRPVHDARGLPSHQQGNRANGVTWDWLVLGRE